MASAKQNRINRMIDVLENSSSWVSSSMLAGLLGASERSIRNYVAEVNETGAAIGAKFSAYLKSILKEL